MKTIKLNHEESAIVYRALDAGISFQLKRLANARSRIGAAYAVGATPDKRDVGNAEYCERAVEVLRKAKHQLEDKEDPQESAI